MAVTDTDYSLIMLKLTQFEDKLKKLEQEIESFKCKNAAHKESDLMNSYKKEMVKAFYGDPPYALSSGSLMDCGEPQVWMNSKELFKNLVPENSEVEIGGYFPVDEEGNYIHMKLAKEGEDFEE